MSYVHLLLAFLILENQGMFSEYVVGNIYNRLHEGEETLCKTKYHKAKVVSNLSLNLFQNTIVQVVQVSSKTGTNVS